MAWVALAGLGDVVVVLISWASRQAVGWYSPGALPFPFTVLGFIMFGVVFVGVSSAAALAFLLLMAFAKRGSDARLLLLLLGLLGLPCRRSGPPTSLVEGRGRP